MLTKKESVKKAVKASRSSAKLDSSVKSAVNPEISSSNTPDQSYTPVAKNNPSKEVIPSNSLKKQAPKTRVIVKFDVGFSNALFIRGEGAGLSWNVGVKLKNIKADEWIWESDLTFQTCSFKILINDHQFEIGENHILSSGTTFSYTPNF